MVLRLTNKDYGGGFLKKQACLWYELKHFSFKFNSIQYLLSTLKTLENSTSTGYIKVHTIVELYNIDNKLIKYNKK